MRAHKLAIRPSSSKIVDVESITTEGADIVEYTTYGITLLGSDFLETRPAIFLIDGSVRLRFASPTTLFYISCASGTIAFFVVEGRLNVKLVLG